MFEMFTTKTSYEPCRSSAYSEDLRWRVVWQREALGYRYSKIASNLGIDKSTVSRTLQLFYTTGLVTKRTYNLSDTNRLLTTPVKLMILNLVISKPGIYLREIQKEVEEFFMFNISIATICKFLYRSGFTRQRLRTVAILF